MKQFKDLLAFEFHFYQRKPLFYLMPLAFAVLGFLMGRGNGILFPNVYLNSPYSISYLTGLLSLAAVFPITLFVAQHIRRETDVSFDALIYATPVRKFNYLFSRFVALATLPIVTMMAAMLGIFVGNLMNILPADKTGAYRFMNYLWPFLVLALPNILLCISILCSIGWLTKNKLIIYISGLLIYIFYFLASMFSNSPLIAGSAPVSDATMAIFSKVDPFGMAAYFEQTRFFTALQRNTLQLALKDNFLFNRLIWLMFSIAIISFAYFRFSFRKIKSRHQSVKIDVNDKIESIAYQPTTLAVGTFKHQLHSFYSFFRIDTGIVLKGIPFKLILMMWVALLGIQLSDALKGDIRIGENFADTGLIISTIAEILPTFALLVILFYSSELLWKSSAVKFNSIENITPVNPGTALAAKFAALAVIPLALLLISCAIGIGFQVMYQPATIDPTLYLLLFYVVGVPLLLCLAFAILLQHAIKAKYIGLLITSIFLLLTSTAVGKMIGLAHPLLRFGQPLGLTYFDMNGFGSYLTAFNWYNAYYLSVTVLLAIALNFKNFEHKQNYLRLLTWAILLFCASGGYIFYQTDIKYENLSNSVLNDRKQAYEQRYKKYEEINSPVITSVNVKVDLFPEEDRYEVSGSYQLTNHGTKPIDSVLVYTHPLIKLDQLQIQNAQILAYDQLHRHTWYRFKQPLQPGAVAKMNFKFSSGWSPFTGHTAFNSIIANGSFMRISNYFPSFGYKAENEIGSTIERKKRGMKPQNAIPSLEEPLPTPYDYRFIDFDAIVSTAADQTAITSGNLIKQWTSGNRNYFHYKTAAPIPFRFAFSSARYKIKKDCYKGIPIEVYYDGRHEINTTALIEEAKRTLAYCESYFGAYSHQSIRFAEISAFAEGFAATAYPGVIYMKENASFYSKLLPNEINGITMLAGHELAHQWWGGAKLVPPYKEGGWLLTETIANYIEVMLYRAEHGQNLAVAEVKKHLNQYLSLRGFSKETPLYKTTYETPHLPYDKGLVVMHQLAGLMGEGRLNLALKNLLSHHAYPQVAPTSLNLITELNQVATAAERIKIDELFKQVITYDSKINSVSYKKLNEKVYEVSFIASSSKFKEDGFGKRIRIPMDQTIAVAVYSADKKIVLQSFPIIGTKLQGKIMVNTKPVRIVIDPKVATIDSFPTDNEKEL